MKAALCFLVFCIVALYVVNAEEDDLFRWMRESLKESREIGKRETKTVGAYQFTYTYAGNGKYDCECRDSRGASVYIAFCTVRDKSFAHTDCKHWSD